MKQYYKQKSVIQDAAKNLSSTRDNHRLSCLTREEDKSLCTIPTDHAPTYFVMDSGVHRSNGFRFSVHPDESRDPYSPSRHPECGSGSRDTMRGFTLVELAIALMVIGLLIGGVLKGQELIENARTTRTIKDIQDYEVAVMLFRNTYHALPGDMLTPSGRLPNCMADPCQIAGNNDGEIDSNTEGRNFWVHLHYAGLIGQVNEQGGHYESSPINAYGGYTSMYHGDSQIIPTPATNNYSFGERQNNSAPILKITRVRALDHKMDDGIASTGRIRAAALFSGIYVCHDISMNDYLTGNNDMCRLSVISESAN